MAFEGFFDFIICGYLNMKTALFSFNGEILGLIFGIFSLFTSGFLLPLITIVALIIFQKYNLKKEDFERNWIALFEMVKAKTISS
jgi:hypothetical protein